MLGDQISHYVLGEQIGGGGMGVVYRARDERLKRDVALKFLPPNIGYDDGLKQRFLIEARAASALDHPNICTIFEVDETTDGQLFIAMALYEGETLRDALSRGALPVDEALEIAIQLADGLVCAHAEGIVHRDVKPANVVLTEGGLAKLLDFGLAKYADFTFSEPGAALGTVAYMSPEQARGESVDGQSDVWSLGVVLYEMLSGERPFQGASTVMIQALFDEDPAPLAAPIPRDLAGIVMRALSKKAADRHSSMEVLLEELRSLRSSRLSATLPTPPLAKSVAKELSRPARAVPILLVLGAMIGASAWWLHGERRVTWARSEALPQLEEMVQSIRGDNRSTLSWEALAIAQEVEAILGEDSRLDAIWPRIACEFNFHSDPPGARVRAKAYGEDDADWITLGTTPIEAIRIPVGISHVELDLDGHEPVRDILWGVRFLGPDRRYVLDSPGAIPAGMVRVAVEQVPLQLPGLDHLAIESMKDFLIDRFEVTNAEFKRFVDAGGYEQAEYWKAPFLKDGETITFEQACELFVDSTGRRGPAGWEVGQPIKGSENHPVGGLSWYEAAAYAEFAGKELPTPFHWNMAAFTYGSFAIIPRSNFGDDSDPVGMNDGENRFGTRDMAGNVREWCWNESTRDGARFILGGGWDDLPYAFNDAFAADPFDRALTNGVRCISIPTEEPNRERLSRAIETPFRDFTAEEPASDEAFALYLRQFDYDATPLNSKVDKEEVLDHCVRLEISFDAAYGDERMQALLFLPRDTSPPYQTIVMFPGSNAIHTPSSELVTGARSDYLLKGGRALLLPIYKGTYERSDELDSDYPEETNFYKDHVIQWAKDLSLSIDYLETRDDIDSEKLAYYGVSWGGAMGAIMPAIETRIRCNLLYVAGLLYQRALPEVDQINYVTRVKQPTLMLNGEFDFFFPVEGSQKPMFELLGAAPEDKRYKIYPGAHSVPRNVRVKEFLDWLDKYLGPVN